MNAATTYLRTRLRLQDVLERHWSEQVKKWNDSTVELYKLPEGKLWDVSAGVPDSKYQSTRPCISVIAPSSTFSVPVTNTRNETQTLNITAEIPDSKRGVTLSIDLAQIAARLAADIIETHFTQATAEGPTYRVDWVNAQVFTSPTKPGAACVITVRPIIRMETYYQPDVTTNDFTPTGLRANLLFNSTLTLMDGLIEVYSGVVQPGDVISVETSAETLSLVLSNTKPFSAAMVSQNVYLTQNQLIAETIVAGEVTATVPSDNVTIRVLAWDETSATSTYVSIIFTTPTP